MMVLLHGQTRKESDCANLLRVQRGDKLWGTIRTQTTKSLMMFGFRIRKEGSYFDLVG